MRSMNRRDIFPTLGATALAGIAAAGLAKPETLTAAPVAKPEGKSPSIIMAAYHSYFEAEAAIDSISTEPHYSFGSYNDHEQMERAERHIYQRQIALQTLGSLPSSTKEELRAKANVLLHHLPGEVDALALDRESAEIKLALSLAADAARLSWNA